MDLSALAQDGAASSVSPAAPAAGAVPASQPLSPPLLKLAWRQTWRDLRAGELRLLLVAVVLAVAALSAVGFFADRLNAALLRDAGAVMGGDAVVTSDKPLPPDIEQMARAQGLAVMRHATFPTMTMAPAERGGALRLAAVKGVSATYPVRGSMVVRTQLDAPPQETREIPAQGSAWVDPAVLDGLRLGVGDTLLVGEAQLRIERVIVSEPDRGTGFMSFAPRVMINEADLPAASMLMPTLRIIYRLGVSAPDDNEARVRRFVAGAQGYIRDHNLRGARVETLDDVRPEMRQTLDRASKFLNLVALLAALLAAVAVAIAARDFAQRHLDDCAMLRVLGLRQRAIASAYALEFGAVGLLASLAGVAAGWGVHLVFVQLLGPLLELRAQLPAPSIRPLLFGVGVGMTLLMAFGLPPVLQLARVPALRVIRRDLGQPKMASVLVLAAGALGFAGLMLAAASDRRLGLITVGGFAAALAGFALCAWGAVLLLRHTVPRARRAPRWLVLATRQLAARPGFAVLQVAALAVGMLALVLLVLVRTDLINGWRQATPRNAPDHVIFNIQPEQAQGLRERLEGAGVTGQDFYAVSRGRLVAINGEPVTMDTKWRNDTARRMGEREWNIGYSEQQPKGSSLKSGEWTSGEPGTLSMEWGPAGSMGLKLGDRLSFDVGGQRLEGRITSLRNVDWSAMRLNFVVIVPRKPDPTMDHAYVAAYRMPAARPGFDGQLLREFPGITSVDLTTSLAQVQSVLDQVSQAVEFLFGFTLASGLVVLFAAVAATREARAREYAVMRALGASRGLLRRVQGAELIGVGALAGLLAASAGMGVGHLLARYVFHFTWQPSPQTPLAGMAAGALLALAAGWWSLRGVLRRPVVQTLRRTAQ